MKIESKTQHIRLRILFRTILLCVRIRGRALKVYISISRTPNASRGGRRKRVRLFSSFSMSIKSGLNSRVALSGAWEVSHSVSEPCLVLQFAIDCTNRGQPSCVAQSNQRLSGVQAKHVANNTGRGYSSVGSLALATCSSHVDGECPIACLARASKCKRSATTAINKGLRQRELAVDWLPLISH